VFLCIKSEKKIFPSSFDEKGIMYIIFKKKYDAKRESFLVPMQIYAKKNNHYKMFTTFTYIFTRRQQRSNLWRIICIKVKY
jgi:hypothetical protein